ncbi:hypothetical protein, partial [Escherichia coli]
WTNQDWVMFCMFCVPVNSVLSDARPVGRIRRSRRIRQETPDRICLLSIYLILQLNPSAQANPAIINYAFLLIR